MIELVLLSIKRIDFGNDIDVVDFENDVMVAV